MKYLQISHLLESRGTEAMLYLAAAVSDFYVQHEKMPTHKIQSNEGNLNLTLSIVPKKLDSIVNEICPKAFVVSFKLETDESILIDKARGALVKYGHQLVIANLLETRKAKVTLVERDSTELVQMSQDLIIGRINPLVTKNGTTKTRRVIEFFLPKTESWVKKSHLANPFSEDISILRNIPWRYSARHTFAVGAMALCEVGIKSGEPLKFLKEGGYDIGLTSDYDSCGAILMHQTSLARSYYGADFPEVDKIGANFDVAFVNTVDLLESTRVTTGKIKHIGGIAIKQPKKLDKIQTEQMPQKIRRAFAQAFASFPEYAFLWKYDAMPDDDVVFSGVSNAFRFKWLPQRDLLAHDRTVAFISHMGLNSYMEAAFSGVPILAVPIFTDQFHNTRTAVKRGVAFKVNKNNITFDSIKHGLEEILHNPKYRENSKRVKKMLNDRPENSKEIFVK
ncbi:hypothetical protein WR25_14239 [Diploscapter pachys]|uniref:glucuronosyltransferase n=1 Tax=Diploscapter pachys TaxID=2018661 RepID=A0A2A2KQ37_9BILA|nr:hypothetical protein WR25_14239 [Diploscapter pachys]